jgi:tetratricopeptide (TPR) repeat protein
VGASILCILLAASAGHRAKAERFEALGRMAEAAREYENAWDEEQSPELLYRLGIVRRKLKQYGKAREALRAYLRAAPDGALRAEVERQLAKIEVLIEAQREDYSDAPQRKRAAPPAAATPPPVPAPSEPSPPESAPPIAAALPETPPPVIAAVPMSAAEPAPLAAAARPSLSPVLETPRRSRTPLWFAGASALCIAGGAALWWDGARVSNQLDARFAAGDLSAGDRPLFGRARGESIAGRALVAAGVGLLAAAVVLAW